MARMIIKVQGREFAFPEFDSITGREAQAIKDVTKLRMGELPEAFAAGDVDAILALLTVAKLRADKAYNKNELLDLPLSSIEVTTVDDGAAEGNVSGSPSENENNENESASEQNDGS